VFASTVAPSVTALQTEQSATFTTLSTLLTNHGSDWIDQSLGGGLSYSEFCKLDLSMIKRFGEAFDEFVERVMMERINSPLKLGRNESTDCTKEPHINDVFIGVLRVHVKDLNDLLKTRVICAD
jgi:hypothetical protein